MEWSGAQRKRRTKRRQIKCSYFSIRAKSAMHMASETLSVSAIVFCICSPINRKNKRQFNFLPLVKYLYFIFRITPTIDIEPTFRIKQKITAVANYCNSRFCYQLAFCGSLTLDIILPQARISRISGIHLTA